MLKAVIFDFDGVIADSFSAVYSIQKKIAATLGKGFRFKNHDEFKDLFTTDWRKFYIEVLGVDEKDLPEAGKIFRKEMMKLLHDIEIFGGMKDVIINLHTKYRVGIVSSNISDIVRTKLEQFEIADHVDFIVGGETGKLKPDPQPLLQCIDALGAKPDEACFIGDSEDDIKTGRNAGVKRMIAVSYGFQHEGKLKHADVILHKPGDILKELMR